MCKGRNTLRDGNARRDWARGAENVPHEYKGGRGNASRRMVTGLERLCVGNRRNTSRARMPVVRNTESTF